MHEPIYLWPNLQKANTISIFSSWISTIDLHTQMYFLAKFQPCMSLHFRVVALQSVPATEELNCTQQGMQGVGKINYIHLQKSTNKKCTGLKLAPSCMPWIGELTTG